MKGHRPEKRLGWWQSVVKTLPAPIPERRTRKEIATALRQLFDAGMKRKLAQFVVFKNKGNRQIKPGTQVYRRESAPDLYFFILLEIQMLPESQKAVWLSLRAVISRAITCHPRSQRLTTGMTPAYILNR